MTFCYLTGRGHRQQRAGATRLGARQRRDRKMPWIRLFRPRLYVPPGLHESDPGPEEFEDLLQSFLPGSIRSGRGSLPGRFFALCRKFGGAPMINAAVKGYPKKTSGSEGHRHAGHNLDMLGRRGRSARGAPRWRQVRARRRVDSLSPCGVGSSHMMKPVAPLPFPSRCKGQASRCHRIWHIERSFAAAASSLDQKLGIVARVSAVPRRFDRAPGKSPSLTQLMPR